MRSPRKHPLTVLVIALAAVVATATGCASVPGDSPVQVIRKVTEGDRPVLPPGPSDNANPLDLVRGFVNASGSAENRHAAARRFLTDPAQSWDDNSSLTVLSEQFGTVYARSPGEGDRAVVRLRGTQLGRVMANGSFVQAQAPIEMDIQVARINGQWRIDGPPSGTIVRLSDFKSNFKSVRIYFLDPMRRSLVPDVRYLPSTPARTLPSRVIDQLLDGPSEALTGAVVTAVPHAARLRSNVAESQDRALMVDLTELGDLDDGQRRLLAAQVVLSLAEVNVPKVRLYVDGAPLVVDHPDLTREFFADLDNADGPRSDVPGLVVVGGKARTLTAGELGGPLAGPTGSGGYDLTAATMSPDGQRLAAVNRQSGRQLMIGRIGGPLAPTGVQGGALTRPTWTPTGNEIWTVRDGRSVMRVLDPARHAVVAPVDAAELTVLGPVNDLRLSKDGMRVAAVVGGMLAVAAVSRSSNGTAALRNVRLLRPAELNTLLAVDWRASDQLVVAGRTADSAVTVVSVDGLDMHSLSTNNLTPPVSAIASSPGRPLLVTDQNGLWTYGADDLGSWRQLVGGSASSIAGYPG
ncbi:LpqB family beta-propeller domain-containing protein [Pseudonocardia acaciae]|uniref:LpqB family beta-propeller domain-containing protein n=1 Tax=Pseudonocardia acaciae TaxID=551276 RepID=UPI0006884A1C|nr:LpqB family beta-propeller domain-containing protein [Pseudonocardia acaciae]